MSSSKNKLSENSLIIIVGFLASIIALVVFLSGKQSIQDFFPDPSSTADSNNHNSLASEPPISSPVSENSSPPTENSKTLEYIPDEWLPDSYVPNGMSLYSANTLSNEDAAKYFGSDKVDTFIRLEDAGRIIGKEYIYGSGESCKLAAGTLFFYVNIHLFRSQSGAHDFFEWDKSKERGTREEIGENGYIVRTGALGACDGNQDRDVSNIGFQRYNTYVIVSMVSVKDTVPFDDLEKISRTIAENVDLMVVANAK